VESTDRGLFDFAKGKKDENRFEEGFPSEFGEKIEVHEEKKHGSLFQKLHRSSSNSSSSSEEEEEVDENGEKKKKKKNLKDKIKDKICGGKTEETEVVNVDYEVVDNSVPIEKYGDFPEEKKGFVEKIKEKLPGGKKTEETSEYYASPDGEQAKEKKGFLDKIKEKIPGYQHHKEEDKEKEKE
ncbi:hypothetical protein M569_05646, partial [Genlisea aurea]